MFLTKFKGSAWLQIRKYSFQFKKDTKLIFQTFQEDFLLEYANSIKHPISNSFVLIEETRLSVIVPR